MSDDKATTASIFEVPEEEIQEFAAKESIRYGEAKSGLGSHMWRVLYDELGQFYDTYNDGLLGRKTEGFCDDCVAYQLKKTKGDLNITCRRSADELVEQALQGVTDPGQRQFIQFSLDPVSWALWEFGFDARWYQAQAMRCTSQFQATRWGRRSGKTFRLAIQALHLCAFKPGAPLDDVYTVLVVTPYQKQLEKIFEVARTYLAKGKTLKPTRDIHDPHTLEFANGSKMVGFTAGEKTGARSVKIRGQDGNAIIIDEADYLRDEDIDAILAIIASHADCQLFFSSTPTGLPTKFRLACEDPKLGFKEMWVAGQESPEYTKRADQTFRMMFTQIEYDHEVLASFGLPEGGVFLPHQIAECVHDYPLGLAPPTNEGVVIGIDTNDKANGVHAVVMSGRYDDMYLRVLDKAVLRGPEFSLGNAKEMILRLYERWNPSILAFDKGYAHSIIEGLLEYGMAHPRTGLTSALKSYDMGAQYTYNDPINGEKRKRPMKPLMVGVAQRMIQEKRLILPKTEDTQRGIIGQMKRFVIERVSRTGQPIYSQGAEHTLTAMMVAMLSWQLEVIGFDPITRDTTVALAVPPKLPDGLPLPVGKRTGALGAMSSIRKKPKRRKMWDSRRGMRKNATRREMF